jgi:hypothetical protein
VPLQVETIYTSSQKYYRNYRKSNSRTSRYRLDLLHESYYTILYYFYTIFTELGVGSGAHSTEDLDVHSVGNSQTLKETSIIEAENLKAAIEFEMKNCMLRRKWGRKNELEVEGIGRGGREVEERRGESDN